MAIIQQNLDYEIRVFDSIVKQMDQADRTLEAEIILSRLSLFLPPDKKLQALECGCNTGRIGKILLDYFKFKFLYLIGVDISLQSVAYARKNPPPYKAILGDLNNHSLFPQDCFDTVFCFLVLHHIPAPVLKSVFSNLETWTMPGGQVFIFEPNGSNPIFKMSYYLRRLVEIVLGKDFIVRNKLATPNETPHSFQKYRKVAKECNFEVIYEEGVFIEIKTTHVVHLLLKIWGFLLPDSRYSAMSIFMILRRKL
jgi:SAM-dependent methyltransferase